MADPKEHVRFTVTSRFNGHDPGTSFATSRANAEAWAALGLGCIAGEGVVPGGPMTGPPQDKQIKRPPKSKGEPVPSALETTRQEAAGK